MLNMHSKIVIKKADLKPSWFALGKLPNLSPLIYKMRILIAHT